MDVGGIFRFPGYDRGVHTPGESGSRAGNVAKPNAAVIVLTHNSLSEATRPCVESLLRAATGVEFRLVIVDNASTDGTREYLEELRARRPDVSVVLNATNLGFAAGNNAGIRSVEAEYYVLLNNDTIVTDRWLDRLIRFVESHPEAGMAGPVSNAVGNEQVIHVESSDEAGIVREGLAWADRCRGDFFLLPMLGFFCVAIRRKVIEEVGLLDESFGLGTFEDDDYCLRVARHGYKLACVEDVFVYHKANVTFRSAELPALDEIMRDNRRRFEEKHGIAWRTRREPGPFLDLIETYLSAHRDDPEKLVFKIENKLQVVKRLLPRPRRRRLASLRRRVAAVTSSIARVIASAVARGR